MADFDAYIPHNPGDLITAEDWNAMQIAARKDIAEQTGKVQQDLDKFKAEPVDAAKFGGKTPEEWTKGFDDRYVQKADLGSGWGEYRRYFKQLNVKLEGGQFQPALIQHNLHRYPLVDIYELASLPVTKEDVVINGGDDIADLKFLVYYANRIDKVSNSLRVEGEDVVYYGDALPLLMEQFKLTVTPDQLFVDVLNDLWDKMFDPGLAQDNFRPGSYGNSLYIQEEVLGKDKTVQQLDRGGIWDNLRVAIRPRMISAFFDESGQYGGTGTSRVQVAHLSQDVLEIRKSPNSANRDGVQDGIDLMILLRS